MVEGFFMRIGDEAWLRLKRLAKRLNETARITASEPIAQEALGVIAAFLHSEDIPLLVKLLEADNHPETLFELGDWHFMDDYEKALLYHGERQRWTGTLLERLTTDTIDPPALLPRAVEVAMQLGAMDNIEDFESVIESYLETYYMTVEEPQTEAQPGA